MVKTTLYWKGLSEAHPDEGEVCLVITESRRLLKSVWKQGRFIQVPKGDPVLGWAVITTPAAELLGTFFEYLVCHIPRMPVVRTIKAYLHKRRILNILDFVGETWLQKIMSHEGWSVKKIDGATVYVSPDTLFHLMYKDLPK